VEEMYISYIIYNDDQWMIMTVYMRYLWPELAADRILKVSKDFGYLARCQWLTSINPSSQVAVIRRIAV
jgi:hypothetical protein